MPRRNAKSLSQNFIASRGHCLD